MPEAARQQGPALFPSGVVCDRFRIDGVLGVGGTGTVFRALDLEREEIVALKAIPHDATLRQRARREASVAGKLRHPNVVRLRSVHEDGQYVYIASDIVEGVDLAGALRQGQLGDAALLRVAAAVCAGLAHAHEHGVVHRDVKPANVLLGRDGSVRVLDFGIATLDEPDATVDDRMLGTLSYMAPETCQGGRPTPATDVWAVGVMVYEALTGANPYRARTPDELRERHRHPPRSLGDLRPDLPRALAAACARALAIASAPPPERRGLRPRALGAAADAIERPASASRARRPAPPGRARSRARCRRCPRRPAPARRCRACPPSRARSSTSRSGSWGEGSRALRPPRASREARAAGRAAGCRQRLLRAPDRLGARRLPVLAVRARAAARLRGRRCSRSPRPGSRPPSRSRSACPRSATSRRAWPGARRWPAGCGSLACVRAGRRALLPAAAPLLAALFLWPLYVLAAGSLRSVARPRAGGRRRAVRDRALGGRAARGRPLAAAPTRAAWPAACWPGPVRRCSLQSAAWALAAAVLPYVLASARRGALIGVWLAGLLAGQAALPALAGAAPEPAVRSAVAIWAVAILLALGVRAPDDDAPAGKPVPAEE